MATKVSIKDLPQDKKYTPGFDIKLGITDENSETKYGCFACTYMPPKSESEPHYHENGDMFFYVISGKTVWRVLEGEEKKEYITEAGDFFYIPRGEVHNNYNPSATESVVGVGGYFGCSNLHKSKKVFVEW